MKKIVIFTTSCSVWGGAILYRLLTESDANCVRVFVQTPRSAQDPEPSREMCSRYDVPYCYIDNANDDEFIDEIGGLEPDVIISFAWGQIFDSNFLNAFSGMLFNVHPSLLPAHRGANPFQSVKWAGDSVTGYTVHVISERIDDGLIVLQEKVAVGDQDSVLRLMHKVGHVAALGVVRFLKLFFADNIEYESVDSGEYVNKISNDSFLMRCDDSKIDVLKKYGSANPGGQLHFYMHEYCIVISRCFVVDDDLYNGEHVGSIVEKFCDGFSLKMNGYIVVVDDFYIHDIDCSAQQKRSILANKFKVGEVVLV